MSKLRLLLLAIGLVFFGVPAHAADPVRIYLTSGSSWTVPDDWNSADNTIEAIGGVYWIRTGTNPLDGIGGGAYSKISNLSLVGGASVAYQIGDGSAVGTPPNNGDTWFSSVGVLLAKAGVKNSGGQASSGVGDVKYSGGTPTVGGGAVSRGQGGGAAGPFGDGGDAGDTSGGDGGAGFGGVGATFSNPAGNGTEWDSTHGSGGGGAAGNLNAGNYGGGPGWAFDNEGGIGANGVAGTGLIVITYTPAPPAANNNQSMMLLGVGS